MLKKHHQLIKLEDIVEVSGMSRRGLFKAFKKHVGFRPGQILRHARIEHAKLLLLENDLPLKKIAEKCGYASENTLCVAFQRATGMAPKKFQRRSWLVISRSLGQRRSKFIV